MAGLGAALPDRPAVQAPGWLADRAECLCRTFADENFKCEAIMHDSGSGCPATS